MVRLLAAAVCVACTALAQTAAPDLRPGSVSGVVKDASTHQPLSDCHVSLNESVKTDEDGRFSFTGVKPGRQWISVNDDRRAASGGVALVVRPGEDRTGIEILLKVGGAVSGRVLDGDSPVAGVSVVLLERHFEFGQLVYEPRRAVATDAEGRYRLDPVPSERPFLLLARKPLKSVSQSEDVPADPAKRPFVPMPTYYPAARFASDAQPVSLMPGETLHDINIRIIATTPFCVQGELRVPAEAKLTTVTIHQVQALVSGVAFTPIVAKLSDAGAFRACGLAPGEYQLSSVSDSSVERMSRRYAFADISIVDQDPPETKLLVRRIADVPGDAVWDPPPANTPTAQLPPNTVVRSPLVELSRVFADEAADEARPRLRIMSMMSMGDYIEIPGPFRLAEIIPNDYKLGMRYLPSGCYLKGATYGGIDVLHGLLRLTRPEMQLHLAVGCDGGHILANVTDHDGNPVSGCHLYLWPRAASSEGVMSGELISRDIETGWANVTDPVAPGKYLALACDLELDGTAEPILKLWRARSRATEIEIPPNGTAQIKIEIIDVN